MKKTLLPLSVIGMSLCSSQAAITYFDASFTDNTTLADGTAMVEVANEATAGASGNPESYYVTNGTVNTGPSAPNNWGVRIRPGSNEGSVLVGPQAGDAATLRTRLTGLTDGTYDVYVYFMSNGAWEIEGGLTEATLATSSAAPLAVAADFATPVPSLEDSAGIDLFQLSIGQATVSGGTLDVFIDDVGLSERTWYEGVGIEAAVPEPSSALLGLVGALGLMRRRR